MPFADNLYSANDDSDDDESFSEELSPTDGYFNRGDISPNIMVPDPSLETSGTAEAKAREARQEARANGESQARSITSPTPSTSTASQLYTSAPATSSPRFSPPSRGLSSPVSPRRTYHDLYSEQSPLLAGPAGPPPAYSPASPSVDSNLGAQPARNYSTFTPHQLEEANPQSMGVPADEPNESSPLWSRQTRKWRSRAVIQNLLFTLLILSVAFAILMTVLRSGHASRSGNDRTPPTKDPSSGVPQVPSNPNDPERISPPLPGGSTPYCDLATYRVDEGTFAFPMDTKLFIKQSSYNEHSNRGKKYVSTTGEIHLRPIPEDSLFPEKGYFTINVYSSDPKLAVKRTFDIRDRSLKVSTPKYEDLDSNGPHCISVEITAWIPEGAMFDSVDIQTVELSQRVFEGTKLNVRGVANFHTVTGGVHSPEIDESDPAWRRSSKKKHRHGQDQAIESHDLLSIPSLQGKPPTEFPNHNFSSRRITVSTTSGSIDGAYPLYDFLGIESISGSVSVGVSPQKIDPKAPAPAELHVETKSGSIDVRTPIHGPAWLLPPREYLSTVNSISGSLQGAYITGTKGEWTTESGSVHIDVLPIIESERNEFHTACISGSTQVDLLDPIFIPKRSPTFLDENPSDPYRPISDADPYILPPVLEDIQENTKTNSEKKFRSLVSSHTSKSGQIQVQYPPLWQGGIQAYTVAGSISVTGDDIEILKDGRKDWYRREVIARKPKGEYIEAGEVSIESTSGSIQFKA